jgi:hypothetical protein
MEKNNLLSRRVVSSSVLFSFLAILLCAPNVRADLVVPSGETMDINYDVAGVLEIFGTANLYPGASVTDFIYAFPGAEPNAPGGIVNIYGGSNSLAVLTAGDTGAEGLSPVVTVYGSMFQIGTDTPFSPPDDRMINGTLNVLDESDQVLFSTWIFSDIDIHLRAPGSEEEEKERLEAELSVSPTKIYRHRTRPVVFATLRLPEGVTKDDVDSDCPFMLSAGKNEIAIKASYKRMYQSCRQKNKSSRVKIFAFFNMTELLEGTADNCEEMQLQACGKLKSGQEFYGSDTIRIINPRKKHWRSRVSMRNKYRYR